MVNVLTYVSSYRGTSERIAHGWIRRVARNAMYDLIGTQDTIGVLLEDQRSDEDSGEERNQDDALGAENACFLTEDARGVTVSAFPELVTELGGDVHRAELSAFILVVLGPPVGELQVSDGVDVVRDQGTNDMVVAGVQPE